jgi:hypothetical protein
VKSAELHYLGEGLGNKVDDVFVKMQQRKSIPNSEDFHSQERHKQLQVIRVNLCACVQLV